MSPGLSKLNPYAEVYVPIAKRVNGVPKSVDSVTGKTFPGSNFQNATDIQGEENHDGDGQLEMDLACLQSLFPSISEQSIIEVYSVSEFDLETAQDILRQLEHDSETPQNLPDSLDIGDVSEPQILPAEGGSRGYKAATYSP